MFVAEVPTDKGFIDDDDTHGISVIGRGKLPSLQNADAVRLKVPRRHGPENGAEKRFAISRAGGEPEGVVPSWAGWILIHRGNRHNTGILSDERHQRHRPW